MKTIVADSGPLRYLILIETIDILPHLSTRVLIPEAVAFELSRPSTPQSVREWLAAAPAWLERRPDPPALAMLPPQLGAGERAAIALAHAVQGTLLVLDDRAGVETARMRGLHATGTLGLLLQAAQLDLIDLKTAITRLRATNFRYRPELLDALLSRHEETRR